MTLREHLEAIRELHRPVEAFDEVLQETWKECDLCAERWPCLTRENAVAALAILDDAELISEYAGGSATEKSHWRCIPERSA